MIDFGKPILLCVDDDTDILDQLKVFLSDKYSVITASRGIDALQVLSKLKPDVILMDVMMPGMDGYQVCSQLQANPDTAWLPVIFISALGEDQDRARAFAAGAVDYLVKPVNRQTVRELVDAHMRTGRRWQKTREAVDTGAKFALSTPGSLQDHICKSLDLTGEKRQKMLSVSDSEIYAAAGKLGLLEFDVAGAVAQYKKIPFVEFINPDSINLGSLPAPFSRANSVVVLKLQGKDTLVLSNPYDMILQDSLAAVLEPDVLSCRAITDPGNIEMLFEKEPAPYITDRLILIAVRRQASEIQIEAGEFKYIVSFKVDGLPTEFSQLKRELGFKLVSRFKVLAGIAAADKAKGHDGYYTHRVEGKVCYLRLVVTNTALGDSLNIRLVEVT